MKKIPLHVKIIIAMLLGIIWTFYLKIWEFYNLILIGWLLSVIFSRGFLKFIAVPLVLFSIIKGFQVCQIFQNWAGWV